MEQDARGRDSLEAQKSSKKATAATEVCAIIGACRTAGVSSLKWRDLEIVFAQQGPEAPADLPKTDVYEYAPPESGQGPQVDDTIATVDKDLLEDMRRSQLMIDDPASFEQEVIDSHLRQGATYAESEG